MSELLPGGGNTPSQNHKGTFTVKQTKKKQKNKPFVNHSNSSTPSPPPPNGYRPRPYYGYRQFNGMSLRPNVEASSRGMGSRYRGRPNAPLFLNSNIEVQEVSPALSPDPARRPPLLPTPPRGPPRFVRFPPPRGRPHPRFSLPPPNFPFPPSFPPPRLPFRTPPPALPSTSKGAATNMTHAAAQTKSQRNASFVSGNGSHPGTRGKGTTLPRQPSPPLRPPIDIPGPESEPMQPFKLSEKTRVHLQLQLQEISKRYEMREHDESTWEPLPLNLLEKLGIEDIQPQQKDEVDATPSTSTGPPPTQQQNTSDVQVPANIDAYKQPYEILIEDPFQKDANINYAERYPNLTDVKALCLFQPASDDDEDDETE